MTAEITQHESIVLADGEGERISFRGVEVLFKSPTVLRPGVSEQGWTVIDYTLPPKQFGAPPHYHFELIETFYVLNGELWMLLGDRELTLTAGSFALASPGTLHAFANRSNAPVRFLAHASRADHKNFLREIFQLADKEPVWPPPDRRKMLALGARYDTFYL
jgi:quercetin dioxygenase-like cupin family protein